MKKIIIAGTRKGVKDKKEGITLVNEYIDSFPTDTKSILKELREIMKEEVPGGEETTGYGVPVVNLNGKPVIYFAAFKNHTSIYPAPRGAKEFRNELEKYKGGKGTVQFPLDKPLPIALIKRIVRFRLKLVGGTEKN
jgi:uncharacterized protein YdhG (YjbR/CyaY superfamily)